MQTKSQNQNKASKIRKHRENQKTIRQIGPPDILLVGAHYPQSYHGTYTLVLPQFIGSANVFIIFHSNPTS